MSKKLVPGHEKPNLTEDGRIAGVIDPSDAQDATTKAYVDLAVSNLSWDFYFNDTGSGIGAYYEMHPDPTGESEVILTTSALSGSAQAVFQWISDEVVNFETIEAGVIDVHIHARRASGNKSVELYAELYEYKADTSEVLITTTEVSAALTNGEQGYDFHVGISTDYDIISTSKLLVKILANLGTGSATTIDIYIEGTHDSHVSVKVPTHTLENLYVRRDILTAKGDIYGASANDTPTRLAVGANDEILTAASGETTGMKWAAATGITLTAALSADGTYSGITEAGTLGETVAFGECVYLKAADSEWYLAKADVTATSGAVKIGICLVAADDGQATIILRYGKVRADAKFPTFTISAPVFISEATGGALTSTAPTGTTDFVVRIVGHANTADELAFEPDNTYVELA